MKSNVKNKVKMTDKIAGTLFEKIILTLLEKYEKSDEKETMSFEDYCRALIDLSNKTLKGENNN